MEIGFLRLTGLNVYYISSSFIHANFLVFTSLIFNKIHYFDNIKSFLNGKSLENFYKKLKRKLSVVYVLTIRIKLFSRRINDRWNVQYIILIYIITGSRLSFQKWSIVIVMSKNLKWILDNNYLKISCKHLVWCCSD